MTITIDENMCVGCGICENNCPECFELNEEGIAVVKEGCDGTSCDLEETANMCPVSAIELS